MRRIYFESIPLATLVVLLEILTICFLVSNLSLQAYKMKFAVQPDVFLNGYPLEGRSPEEVTAFLAELREASFTSPRNAFLGTERGIIMPERKGKIIALKRTLDLIREAPAGSVITPKAIALDPELTSAEIEQLDILWADYITYYGGGDRGINIQIAASSINNFLLAPGQIFSFHQAVWPITEEKGYSMAPIIVGGSVVPGRGGGICQVSSTLYNAVLKANLEVVERYPHSMPVYYVPPGRDATVSDYLDFKFRNNTDSYLIIKAHTYGTQCQVEIWGGVDNFF